MPEIRLENVFTGYLNCTQPMPTLIANVGAATHTKLISYERHSRDSYDIHSLQLQP